MQKVELNSADNAAERRTAFKFVLLLGAISFLADITYEGSRSIIGPFLATLGASAAVVGFVAGLGELVGYGLRFFSGYLVDKTSRYWWITFFGYFCNLLAVPLLAFVSIWQMAASLVVAERVGKAVRTPARDAMLSHASQQIGAGLGFGLHQTLDQIGSMLGPLLLGMILFFHGSYRECFLMLFVPALAALVILFVASRLYPEPQNLEKTTLQNATVQHKLTAPFWIYVLAVSCVAFGYADFPLVAFHFSKANILSSDMIPFSYALAMASSAASALALGRLYDRVGNLVLIAVVIAASAFAPLVFLGGKVAAFFGMMFWGVGMGSQGSLLKAVLGKLISKEKRGSAYGVFSACYGVAWFAGSALLGVLYGVSIHLLVMVSVLAQFLFVPLLVWQRKFIK